MHTSKSEPEPDAELCGCGRPLAEAVSTAYHSSHGRLAFHRCQCGLEWTEQLSRMELADPVSSDELIEVHQRLARLDGSLIELLSSA